MPRGSKKQPKAVREAPEARNYSHPEAEVLLRPEVGTQAQFKKKQPPRQYRYDSSLAPELSWDGRNWAREASEWLLALIEEAAKLAAPHEFPEPRRMMRPDGAEIAVGGLPDAVRELAGAKSAPFEAGEHGQVAVKVIDDRGNELLVVKKLGDASR